MNKFKVGDKVIRIQGDFRFVRKGDVCSVTALRPDGQLEIDDDESGSHNPENYELYVEENMMEVLTPLQVSEAFLNEKEVQGLSEDGERWYNVTYPITLSFSAIQNQKFRLKPKTIVINGVEVPAPLKTLAGRKSAFYIDLFRKVLAETLMPYDIKEELMWETKEDAQRVLDAMLIPFNELNKGENHD